MKLNINLVALATILILASGCSRQAGFTTVKDGHFERTPEGLGARVTRPGYPESYARELIKQTGDKFESK